MSNLLGSVYVWEWSWPLGWSLLLVTMCMFNIVLSFNMYIYFKYNIKWLKFLLNFINHHSNDQKGRHDHLQAWILNIWSFLFDYYSLFLKHTLKPTITDIFCTFLLSTQWAAVKISWKIKKYKKWKYNFEQILRSKLYITFLLIMEPPHKPCPSLSESTTWWIDY